MNRLITVVISIAVVLASTGQPVWSASEKPVTATKPVSHATQAKTAARAKSVSRAKTSQARTTSQARMVSRAKTRSSSQSASTQKPFARDSRSAFVAPPRRPGKDVDVPDVNAWFDRMAHPTTNGMQFKDPKVFAQWVEVMMQPATAQVAMGRMMDARTHAGFAQGVTDPRTLKNWMEYSNPEIALAWMQAMMDPAFYASFMKYMQPARMVEWGMAPVALSQQAMQPATWFNWMSTGMNPGTYAAPAMTMMNPMVMMAWVQAGMNPAR